MLNWIECEESVFMSSTLMSWKFAAFFSFFSVALSFNLYLPFLVLKSTYLLAFQPGGIESTLAVIIFSGVSRDIEARILNSDI